MNLEITTQILNELFDFHIANIIMEYITPKYALRMADVSMQSFTLKSFEQAYNANPKMFWDFIEDTEYMMCDKYCDGIAVMLEEETHDIRAKLLNLWILSSDGWFENFKDLLLNNNPTDYDYIISLCEKYNTVDFLGQTHFTAEICASAISYLLRTR